MAFEKHLGLSDIQNLYFSGFSQKALLNSSHFLTLISKLAAMIRGPRRPVSDADRLQLANKATGSEPVPFGCRNRNVNLLLIVAAQRPAHASSMQAENEWSYPNL